MKHPFYLLIALFLFARIPFGLSQTSDTLPVMVKTIADKYNQTLFGKNVLVFDETMNMAEIQLLIDSIHACQTSENSEFSPNRYALLFKSGTYHLNIRVGYYMHIMGLGNSPENVVIIGSVTAVSIRAGIRTGHVLTNFWRTVENLTIVPTVDSTNIWAVSQAAPLRRVYVKGNLKLYDGASSGGFMANCKVDGVVMSGSQQQWFSRNSSIKNWNGGVWNMVYVGVTNAPQENWPDQPVTTINKTPMVREKPYWIYNKGNYALKLPALKKNTRGVDWAVSNQTVRTVSIDEFYMAKPDVDNAVSINKALNKGKHILFTPGIYTLSESIKIKRSGTIVVGMGMATLIPENGNKAIDVSDVDEVTIAGLIIDAAKITSETLMQVGEAGAKKNHQAKPTFLFDVFFRVGGAHEGSAVTCLVINSNHVFVDHVWLWRADHGNGVGWTKSKSANGLIVNGHNVIIYGLFNEHFQEYQTIWNGEKGRVYFYQSEMPYDPPSNEAWKHGTTNGYASYKVNDVVKDHQAWGVGIYGFFDTPLIVDQAIETPLVVENKFYHKVLLLLGWNKETTTIIKSIINGKGGGVDTDIRKRMMK